MCESQLYMILTRGYVNFYAVYNGQCTLLPMHNLPIGLLDDLQRRIYIIGN